MTNYAITKQKFCLKRDKSLRMGFCRKDPPIEDVFVSYKLEKKKKTNSVSSLQPPPQKLRRKPRQPRSQGSLPPALRSARKRIGERTWERGWSRGRCTFFHSPLRTRELLKPISRRLKKKSLTIFVTTPQPCQDQNKNRIPDCWFFFWFIVNVTTGRL